MLQRSFLPLCGNAWKVDVSSEPLWARPDLPARRFHPVSSGRNKPQSALGMTVTLGGGNV